MSLELKDFGGAYFVKDKAKEVFPDLKPLVLFIKAKNVTAAGEIFKGRITEHYPEYDGDYFRAKIWEHREDLPRIESGVFCSDFFDTAAIWNENTKEPEFKPETVESVDDGATAVAVMKQVPPPSERMTLVKDLDLMYRAYCLVMFGPVEEVSASQRGQMLDVYNDDFDVIHPLREQAEAITKEPRVLSLQNEKQTECLTWVRRNARQDAKWPDYKNLFTKWLDSAQETHTETEEREDETQPTIQNETELPAVCPGRSAQLDKELNDVFEKREPAPLTDRETEIAYALNDLISGRTTIMDEGEAAGAISCTGHPVAHVISLLMADITITELHLAPDFSDEEIHDVATTTLDAWTDDLNIRQQVMLDAIVEYRKPAPAPVCTVQPCSDEEVEKISAPAMTTLTYRQQLTIAALQGLCANPAYCNSSEEIPKIADWLATGLSQMLDGDDE